MNITIFEVNFPHGAPATVGLLVGTGGLPMQVSKTKTQVVLQLASYVTILSHITNIPYTIHISMATAIGYFIGNERMMRDIYIYYYFLSLISHEIWKIFLY